METNTRTNPSVNGAHEVAESAGRRPWMKPAADIIEGVQKFIILVDLPGVIDAGVNLEVEGEVLRLTAHTQVIASQGRKLLHAERGQIDFHRQFKLSPEFDANQIEAVLKDGVLKIELPLRKEVAPKKISVKTLH